MAWTQADVDAIEAAIASGTLSISNGDKTITYRSVTEMLKARDSMKAALNGSASRTMTTLAQFSKG